MIELNHIGYSYKGKSMYKSIINRNV